jgi:pimeloyl-ACP methyl ester carboxylesterase
LRFELHLLGSQLLLSLWFMLPLIAAVIAARAAAPLGGLRTLAIGIAAMIAGVLLLWPLVDRWLLLRINNCWPYLHELGDASCFDPAIEAGAARIVAAAREAASDEIVVVGHSAGGAIAPLVLVRAIELDPDIGRRGPRLVLLTVGSLLPAVALRPAARRIREVIARLATEPSLTWIDCVSRKDIMNFWGFDLLAAVKLTGRRRNPLTWVVRFRDMVSPEFYRGLRSSFFRLHFQFIISGDRRAPYDYVMLVAGPAEIPSWAHDPGAVMAGFAADGAFVPPAIEAAPATAAPG